MIALWISQSEQLLIVSIYLYIEWRFEYKHEGSVNWMTCLILEKNYHQKYILFLLKHYRGDDIAHFAAEFKCWRWNGAMLNKKFLETEQ